MGIQTFCFLRMHQCKVNAGNQEMDLQFTALSISPAQGDKAPGIMGHGESKTVTIN